MQHDTVSFSLNVIISAGSGHPAMKKKTRKFQYADGVIHRLWTITLQGSRCVIEYGLKGAPGKVLVHRYESGDIARQDFEDHIRSKINKGYREQC